jgi:hypothetical protein
VGDRNQLHALVQRVAQRLDRQLAVLVVRHGLDGRSRALAHLQEGDEVALVLGVRAEDAIAGLEPQRVERHVPSARGVLDDRHLVALAADELRDRVVGGVDPLVLGRGGLVAADARLERGVAEDRLDHRRGHQCGAGVVEVGDVGAARGLGARPAQVDVDHWASSCRR